MSSSRSHTKLHPVSRHQPCPVCGGDHKCSVGDDGLILCGRQQGPVQGFVHFGPCQNDPTWHAYRDERDAPGDAPAATPPAPADTTDWGDQFARWRRQSSEALRNEFADHLGLPATVTHYLPVGYHPDKPSASHWVLPEYDGYDRIIGVQFRYRNGTKKNHGRRGLTVPRWWSQYTVGPMFCPEGASDVLAFRALHLWAVGRPSNLGGVNHLVDFLRRVPADRPIIVVGDRDAKPDRTWPGRDGASQTAAALREQLGRPVAWALPPAGYKDVRAWVVSQNLLGGDLQAYAKAGNDLRDFLIKEASLTVVGQFDTPPQPLDAPLPPRPFPVRLLPAALQGFVDEAAGALNCPSDFVAVPMLALAGAALGNAWQLEVGENYLQSAALFCAIVGPPGSAKSPALGMVAKPLHQFNQASPPVVKEGEEPEAGAISRKSRCVVDDFTMESLAPILAENPKGLVVVKDELAGLIHGLNQYKGGRGHDRQVLLQLWAAMDIVVDRKNRDRPPLHIPQPFVAIVGGIQPAVLELLRPTKKQVALDDGLLDRFLFSYPDDRPPQQETWKRVSAQAARVWADAVTKLRAQPVLSAADGKGWSQVHVQMNARAKEVWEAFTLGHAREVWDKDFPPGLRGPWSKLRGYALRLALVLHALRWACGEVEDVTRLDYVAMMGGTELVDYFKAHARRAQAQMQRDPRTDLAARVTEWLRSRGDVEEFRLRDVHQSLRRHATPEELEQALTLLAELGYVVAGTRGQTRMWRVSPLWNRGA